jgi:hypothetical protein
VYSAQVYGAIYAAVPLEYQVLQALLLCALSLLSAVSSGTACGQCY